MTIWTMVWKEFFFSRVTSLLMLLAVSGAVAYAVATITQLHSQQMQLRARVQTMDDEIRKITKDMGFNINILPRNQNLVDFYAQDFADKTMPYELVQKLADSNIATLNHLRPALIRKADWPEMKRSILLMGVHGVVPWTHRSSPQPLAEAVPAGTLIIGYELARELNLQVGQSVPFHGRDFKIHQVLPMRGDKDDITVFVDLDVAQQIANLPGQINLIQALECNCASHDRLGEIDRELATVLGTDVQVVELSTKAIARAKARTETEAAGKRDLQDAQDRGVLYSLMAVIVAAGLLACLFLLNVRQREGEIATWRALGWSTTKVMILFLSKALLLGVTGAGLGYVAGYSFAWYGQVVPTGGSPLAPAVLFLREVPVATFLLTPILTVLASWLPALIATTRQPALVLSHE